MNKELMRKWIDALRNGEYKQGRHRLKKTDKKGNESHCCLGVLVEISDYIWINKRIDEPLLPGEVRKCETDIPLDLSEELGLNRPMSETGDEQMKRFFEGLPRVPKKTIDYFLMTLNDDEEWTFLEIADWIEKYLLNQEEG